MAAHEWHHNAFTRPAVQPRQSDAERWQQWCASIEGTIEAIRAAEGPVRCDACGCSAHQPKQQACRVCWSVQPLAEFKRDRRSANGYAAVCRACDREQNRANYQARKQRASLAVAS